jgi:hypothetical protein
MAVPPGWSLAARGQKRCTFQWRGEMKVLTGLALLIGLAACGPRANRETGAAADTTLTTRQTQDTTIVTSDTTVNVDTTKKEGDKPVAKDSLKVKH